MFEGSSQWIEDGRPAWDVVGARTDWRTVDRELRAIARQRGALDASEARWLREAERLQIWRPLGMVSALDYMVMWSQALCRAGGACRRVVVGIQ